MNPEQVKRAHECLKDLENVDAHAKQLGTNGDGPVYADCALNRLLTPKQELLTFLATRRTNLVVELRSLGVEVE